MFVNTLRENRKNEKREVKLLTKDAGNSPIGEKQEKEITTSPKRYSLYKQININERYLDYFIVGVILLLFVVVIYSVL